MSQTPGEELRSGAHCSGLLWLGRWTACQDGTSLQVVLVDF